MLKIFFFPLHACSLHIKFLEQASPTKDSLADRGSGDSASELFSGPI